MILIVNLPSIHGIVKLVKKIFSNDCFSHYKKGNKNINARSKN